jgi:hypothetical protein
LAVKANGYTPIPNRDKRTMFKGWPALDPDAAEIRGWINPRASLTLFAATGMLIVGGLLTIDCDIPDHSIMGEVSAALAFLAPQVFGDEGSLVRGRDDGSPKIMLFCRRSPASGPFTIRSRRWSRDGSENGETFVVEIFASERNHEGKARRQVGVFGPHTVDDVTADVKVRYQWNGLGPDEVKLSDLPEIDKETALLIAETVDRILESRGMKVVEEHPGGEINPEDVYDLDDDSRFDGPDFIQADLQDLEDIYWRNHAIGKETRCTGSFTGDPAAVKLRCQIGWSGSPEHGHVTVHDHATELTHRPKSAERQVDPTDEKLNQLLAETSFAWEAES